MYTSSTILGMHSVNSLQLIELIIDDFPLFPTSSQNALHILTISYKQDSRLIAHSGIDSDGELRVLEHGGIRVDLCWKSGFRILN